MSEQETTGTAAQASATAIERQVTKRTKLVVQGSKQALDNPLFAINWFETRVGWLYHLYNHLSAGRLYKIGGRIFFKGKVAKTIAGDESLARDYLLIINYPSAQHFLDLNADTLFKIFSVLRLITVKNFSFVLHQRIDGPQLLSHKRQQWSKNDAFALLHFSTKEPTEDVVSMLRKIAGGARIRVHFAGRQAATLAVQSGNEPPRDLPFVTQHVVIIEASDPDDISAMFAGSEFCRLTSRFEHFYAATVNRLL